MSRKHSCVLFLVLFSFLLELSGSEALYGGTQQELSGNEANYCIPTDRVFLLKNKKIGKCIDPRGTYNGAKLEGNTCSPDDTGQQWRMDDYGRLIHQASGKCMDVKSYRSNSNGANLQLYTCESPSDSKTDHIWHFSPHGSYFELVNVYTGKCADLFGFFGTSDGRDVQQNTCDANISDRLWEMIEVDEPVRYSDKAAGYNCGTKNPCSTLMETTAAGQYYWPHENHNQYVLCMYIKKYMQCFEMFCGDGLDWNQDLKTCN